LSQHNEAKQHSQNYIEQVCEQVRWKKAHPIVQEELLAHIEDQAEAYQHEGYTADEAEYLAVEQMGDPILADGLQKSKKPDGQVCDCGHHFLLGIAVCELSYHQFYHIADVYLSAAVCTGRLDAYDKPVPFRSCVVSI